MGMLVGVIQRVKGIRPSSGNISFALCIQDRAAIPVFALPPRPASHFRKSISLPCTFLLPSSRLSSGTSISLPNPLFFASIMPLSSNVSLIAASRYASPSSCLAELSSEGTSPSWNGSQFPPGKTWAEGKAEEFCTRCRSRT